jgi:hypothetical protein
MGVGASAFMGVGASAFESKGIYSFYRNRVSEYLISISETSETIIYGNSTFKYDSGLCTFC